MGNIIHIVDNIVKPSQWSYDGWMECQGLAGVPIHDRASFIAIAFLGAVVACGAGTENQGQSGLDAMRRRMVDEQLKARDIQSPRVLGAMLEVPRHLFVPDARRAEAYEDWPLPIGHSQTISQPYIVGFMTQALDVAPDHRVLEVGTGSGYQAAVLARLARDVYSMKSCRRWRIALARRSKLSGTPTCTSARATGILDGQRHAPYDRIIVTAAPDEVPPALLAQLRVGGLMAIPVGTVSQELRILRRTAAGTETLTTLPVRFVPMTNKPRE